MVVVQGAGNTSVIVTRRPAASISKYTITGGTTSRQSPSDRKVAPLVWVVGERGLGGVTGGPDRGRVGRGRPEVRPVLFRLRVSDDVKTHAALRVGP